MNYQIILSGDAEREMFSPWYIDTTVGRFVMIFTDPDSLAEALAFAQSWATGAGKDLSLLKIERNSPAEVLQMLGEASEGEWIAEANYVTNEDDVFDKLLAMIRKQNEEASDQ